MNVSSRGAARHRRGSIEGGRIYADGRVALLNHPNIASIHEFEESDGVHAPVLELVEGLTLVVANTANHRESA